MWELESNQQSPIQQYARSISVCKLPESYVSIDTETTGLDCNKDQLIELSALKVIDGEPVDKFSSLIACTARISPEAAAVNGITKGMLVDAPPIDEVMHGFSSFSSDMILLGHNVNSFDRRFIERECVRLPGITLANDWFDTLELARRMFRGRVGLADLCQRFDVQNTQAHRALSDCIATHECYQAMRMELLHITTDARDFSPNGGFDGEKAFDGKFFVFTGEAEYLSQHDAMQMAIDRGANLQNGITKKTDCLVNIGGGVSAKVKKAAEYSMETGIETINATQFMTLCGIELEPHQKTAAKPTKSTAKPIREESRNERIALKDGLGENKPKHQEAKSGKPSRGAFGAFLGLWPSRRD